MPKLIFREGTVLFAGTYPDNVDEAKAYIKKYGYTKEDVRMFKKKESYKLLNGGEPVEWISFLVEAIKPIAIDCCVIGCPNHEPEEGKENGNT